jgi:hypothetical protein
MIDITSIEEPNEVRVRAAIERWKAGIGSPFELVRPDAEWIISGFPREETFASRQQYLDEVVEPFKARVLAQPFPKVTGIYGLGPHAVLVEFDTTDAVEKGPPYEHMDSWQFGFIDSQIVWVLADRFGDD